MTAGAARSLLAAYDALVDSTISGNTTGIFTTGDAVLQLSNSNVAFNITGLNGTIGSFTNNRFVKNGAIGMITPIGSQPDRPATAKRGRTFRSAWQTRRAGTLVVLRPRSRARTAVI
jgi:hypothetical protein